MTTGNRREGMNGNRSHLLDAVERTSLDGGKDIIIRAINAYVKKHKGEPGLPVTMENINTEVTRLAGQKGEPK